MKIKYKRLLAYLIDIVIVSLIVSLLAGSNIMQKQMDKYNDANIRLEEQSEKILSDDEITEEDEEELKSIIYDINYFGIAYNVLDVVVIISYFAIFQYFNKGKTIGKKILKIKVVSKDDSELSLVNYLLRTIILYNIVFTVINIIGAEFLKFNGFYTVYIISTAINSVVSIILFFMILFRKDERGLHDIISSSKVVED